VNERSKQRKKENDVFEREGDVCVGEDNTGKAKADEQGRDDVGGR
jgi:hypothetical protein